MKRSSDRKLQRKKNVFTPNDDEKLRKLVQKFGDKSWHRIADKMPRDQQGNVTIDGCIIYPHQLLMEPGHKRKMIY